MIRINILLICVLLFSKYTAGQQNDECYEKAEIERVILISPNTSFNAHISFEVCYDEEKNLTVKLSRLFKKDGLVIDEYKVRKQGHKILLRSIIHDSEDIFTAIPNPSPSPKEVITGIISMHFTAIGNPDLKDRKINFTLVFQYEKNRNKKAKTEVVDIELELPDYPELDEAADIVEEVSDSLMIDSIQIIDDFFGNEVTQDETNQSFDKVKTEEEPDSEGYSCVDSLRYYYKQIFGLYNRISGNEHLSEADKEILETQLRTYSTLFDSFYTECEDQRVQQIKSDFDRLSDHIAKRINDTSASGDIQSSDEETKEYKTPTVSGKNQMQFKDLLIYVFGVLLIILLILYIYPKLKKKSK